MPDEHLVDVPLDGELQHGVKGHDEAKDVEGIHQPEINQLVVGCFGQRLK